MMSLSLSQLQDHTKDSGVQVFVQIIWRAAAAMNPQRNLEIQLKGEIVPTEFPIYLWQPSKSILEAVNDCNGANPSTF